MNSKPRIMRIINRFNLGGPTYNASYLTKYLEPDFETMLVGGEKMPSEESSLYIALNLGLDPVVLPEMTRTVSFVNEWRAYRRLRKMMREFRPHIVHTHASKAGALGRMAAVKEGIPHIVHTFHGHVFEGYFSPPISQAVLFSERFLAKRTGKIVAISERQKNDLVVKFGICPEEKIEVIPLGFDLERFLTGSAEKREMFRKEWKLDGRDVAVGIVGRLVPVKDHRFFITMMAGLKSSGLSFKCFVVGDGELREQLSGIAAASGLLPGQDLFFTSWRKDMDVVMAGLDIVALTSKNEGTPVSLIEAQAAGKAIISTDVGGVRDVASEASQSFIINRNDAELYAGKMKELILNKAFRLESGEAGRKYVLERHSAGLLATRMTALYNNLLHSQL